GGDREAAGFRLSADGIVFHLNGEHLSQQLDQDGARTARFRPDFFLDQIRSCKVLQARINTFLAEWLWQTSVAMLSATALRNNCSLREAQSLLTGRRAAAARRVLDSI